MALNGGSRVVTPGDCLCSSVLVTQTEAPLLSTIHALPSQPLGAQKRKAEGWAPSCQQEAARWDGAPGEAAAESG